MRTLREMPVALVVAGILAAGICFGLYYRAFFDSPVILPVRQEMFFALALALAFAAIVVKGGIGARPFLARDQVVGIGLLVGGTLLAALVGAARYGLAVDKTALSFLARLALGVLLFALVRAIVARHERARTLLAASFAARVVVFAPVLLVPNAPYALSVLFSDHARFMGLTYNPQLFAQHGLIAFSFLGAYALHGAHERRYGLAAGAAALAVVAAVLVFWTQSRTQTLLLGVAAVVLLAAWAIRFAPGWRKVALVGGLGVGALGAGVVAVAAWNPAVLAGLAERFTTGAVGQDRIDLFRYFGAKVVENPLGYGPGFEGAFGLVSRTQHITLPHSFLDILLVGGLLAFAGVVLLHLRLLADAARSLARGAPTGRFPSTAGAAAALVSLWTGSLATGAPVFTVETWILMALL